MKQTQLSARSSSSGRARRTLDLPPPRGLKASTFELEGDEYAIFSFPLPDVELPEGLSTAEQAVVRGVLDGRSNAEIARTRATSPNTVANQLRSVYSKLRVSGRVELVKRCVVGRRAAKAP